MPTSAIDVPCATSAASTIPGQPLYCGQAATAEAIGFAELVTALRLAAQEYAAGLIQSPERIGVPLRGEGVSLSMPASAADISIHKLVNVQPANAALDLPTIHGVVTVCDARTGRPSHLLDGPELTGRRTAGVSMLGIQTFLESPPKVAVLIGTGTQAAHHVNALRALHPDCAIFVKGQSESSARSFCDQFGGPSGMVSPCPRAIPDEADVVITLTTSKAVVYDEPARIGRLVIGVGAFKPDMAEIGERTLSASQIYADDPQGARHEAGDLIRAGVDWARVMPLSRGFSETSHRAPVVLKSVGTAAWDLAAARVALATLRRSQNRPPA